MLSGRIYDYRRRVFPADTTTDLGFLLLAGWAVTQLNPEIWLFGNGHLHAIFSWHGSTGYSPSMYALLEAGVAASGYCALILLLSSLARPRAPILDAIVVLTVAALGHEEHRVGLPVQRRALVAVGDAGVRRGTAGREPWPARFSAGPSRGPSWSACCSVWPPR